MTDEERLKLENDRIRGEQIKAFLQNETVQAVFQSLELSYFQAFKTADTPAQRRDVHARARAFDDLRDSLEAVVASGERASHDLRAADHLDPDLA